MQPTTNSHSNELYYAVDQLFVSKITGVMVSGYGSLRLIVFSTQAVFQQAIQGHYNHLEVMRSIEIIKEGGKIAFPVFRLQFNSMDEFLNVAGHDPYLAPLTGLFRISFAVYSLIRNAISR